MLDVGVRACRRTQERAPKSRIFGGVLRVCFRTPFCFARGARLDMVRKKTPKYPISSCIWVTSVASPALVSRRASKLCEEERRTHHRGSPLFTYGGHIDAQVVSGAKMAGGCESDPLALPSTCTIHVLISLSYEYIYIYISASPQMDAPVHLSVPLSPKYLHATSIYIKAIFFAIIQTIQKKDILFTLFFLKTRSTNFAGITAVSNPQM